MSFFYMHKFRMVLRSSILGILFASEGALVSMSLPLFSWHLATVIAIKFCLPSRNFFYLEYLRKTRMPYSFLIGKYKNQFWSSTYLFATVLNWCLCLRLSIECLTVYDGSLNGKKKCYTDDMNDQQSWWMYWPAWLLVHKTTPLFLVCKVAYFGVNEVNRNSGPNSLKWWL